LFENLGREKPEIFEISRLPHLPVPSGKNLLPGKKTLPAEDMFPMLKINVQIPCLNLRGFICHLSGMSIMGSSSYYNAPDLHGANHTQAHHTSKVTRCPTCAKA
jgi:hypothetical protein